MKKKYFNFLIILIAIYFLIEIIINKSIVINSINDSLSLWLSSIVGVLFPFFIISDILINYNITNYIPKKVIKFLSKIFNVSEYSVTILLLSLISGYPSNARNTRTLYDKGLIDKKEASYILLFTHFANPLFILGSLYIFFNNIYLCYIILISHYLANFIIGLIFRKHNILTYKNNFSISVNKSQSFSVILINSIKKSIDSLLTIVGIISCFSVVSTILINNLNLNSVCGIIVNGFFELTGGISSLSKIDISNFLKSIIATMMLSFGGISVHVQVLSYLVDTDIKYKYFFVGRVLQAIISSILCFIFYYLII